MPGYRVEMSCLSPDGYVPFWIETDAEDAFDAQSLGALTAQAEGYSATRILSVELLPDYDLREEYGE